jgi:hypothetical protein
MKRIIDDLVKVRASNSPAKEQEMGLLRQEWNQKLGLPLEDLEGIVSPEPQKLGFEEQQKIKTRESIEVEQEKARLKPPKQQSVQQEVLRKVAKGDTLTEGEEQIWEIIRRKSGGARNKDAFREKLRAGAVEQHGIGGKERVVSYLKSFGFDEETTERMATGLDELLTLIPKENRKPGIFERAFNYLWNGLLSVIETDAPLIDNNPLLDQLGPQDLGANEVSEPTGVPQERTLSDTLGF